MVIGFLKDSKVAISPVVPGNVKKLSALFSEILIEKGIGDKSFFLDEKFEGAKAVDRKSILSSADVVVKFSPDFTDKDFSSLKKDAIVISQFAPFNDPEIVKNLQTKGINAFSLDMIPRTTLAQTMDILSSLGSIAGYQAVLVALQFLPRYLPMMITAAGSIKPSKILVIGAGVAGLQAIATGRRLGAIVEAFDTRTAVKEEVQSLGAKFVEVEGAKDDKDAGGYAVEQSEEYKRRQGELVQERAQGADIVITTAQLRGRPAPKIISKETVELMKPGSVIIDLASSTGGNCVLTQDDSVIVHKGVYVVGDSNLANRMPQDASTLFSNNLCNYLKHLMVDGTINLHSEDEILSKSLISKKEG